MWNQLKSINSFWILLNNFMENEKESGKHGSKSAN
jgi:hypothetical protein